MKRWAKLLAGGFVFLNLTAVVYANRPLFGATLADARSRTPGSEAEYYRLYVGWMFETYANRVGLDNRWQMFGHQSRFNWWYRIKARYADGAEVLLPLPGQTERSAYERLVVDFKEAKFALNVYADRGWRRSYSDYVARHAPARAGTRLEAIVWELHWQNIRSQEDAARTGDHLEPETRSQTLDVFPVGA